LADFNCSQAVRGAFSVTDPAAVLDKEFLLVDDVFTTGTTVWECARILRRAGASKVWVATVARTLKAETTWMDAEREERVAMVMAAAG